MTTKITFAASLRALLRSGHAHLDTTQIPKSTQIGITLLNGDIALNSKSVVTAYKAKGDTAPLRAVKRELTGLGAYEWLTRPDGDYLAGMDFRISQQDWNTTTGITATVAGAEEPVGVEALTGFPTLEAAKVMTFYVKAIAADEWARQYAALHTVRCQDAAAFTKALTKVRTSLLSVLQGVGTELAAMGFTVKLVDRPGPIVARVTLNGRTSLLSVDHPTVEASIMSMLLDLATGGTRKRELADVLRFYWKAFDPEQLKNPEWTATSAEDEFTRNAEALRAAIPALEAGLGAGFKIRAFDLAEFINPDTGWYHDRNLSITHEPSGRTITSFIYLRCEDTLADAAERFAEDFAGM